MSARRWRSLLALLVVAALLVGGCGGNDGDSDSGRDDSSSESADHDSTSDDEHADPNEADEGEPTPAPEPVPAGELPPIQILAPTPFQELVGSVVLSGSAQVAEGTIAWAILDAKLRPMVRGTTTATCGAPCRGTFRATISLAKVPIGSWELHAWSPNTSEGGNPRLHDTMVPVTVVTRPTAGVPDPGAIPPGGVPQG